MSHYHNAPSKGEFHIGCDIYSVEYRIYGSYYPATYEEPAEYPEVEVWNIKVIEDGFWVPISLEEENSIYQELQTEIWMEERDRDSFGGGG